MRITAVALITWNALLGTGCTRGPAEGAPRPSDALRSATGDSVSVDTIASRIVHYRVRRPTGPFNIHVVTVPVAAGYELAAARALDSLHGRERVTDMVRRRRERGERIPVALNADFFDLRTGANENNQVIDGEVWKAVPVTDSPHDTFRNAHTQFAIGATGRPYLDRFAYAGSLASDCGRFAVDGINGIPRAPDALVIFTGAWADTPMADSVRSPAQLVAAGPSQRRPGIDDVDLTIVAALGVGPSGILPNRYILGAYGTARARLDSIARCASSPFRLTHGFRPDRGRLTMIAGGWPRVVTDGRNVAASADSVEGTFPRFSAQRHPRSAVGFSRDSSVVYLVAVDGRQEASAGMTLVELGDFLVSIGVFQGLNLDGGGSTALVINGRVVNKPSDPNGERAVGNAILVREK